MIDNEKVTQAVMDAIDELNEQLPKEERLERSIDTQLFGSKGSLDSLGLISLVTTVEQIIEEKFGVTATLLEDIDILDEENPFKNVKTLADYITSIMEKNTIE